MERNIWRKISRLTCLQSQIRELYGRVVWTHKTQKKCADILWKRHTRLKVAQIALSALTTTGILVAVFGDNRVIGVVSAILSALLFGINTYSKDYDLGAISQKHSAAASQIWNIRESYLSLLTDLRSGTVTSKEIIAQRDKLQEKLFTTYKGAPRTINAAYREATKGLHLNEELTFSDEEIDHLLPRELRIKIV